MDVHFCFINTTDLFIYCSAAQDDNEWKLILRGFINLNDGRHACMLIVLCCEQAKTTTSPPRSDATLILPNTYSILLQYY